MSPLPDTVVTVASELIKHNLRRIGHDLVPRPVNGQGEIHVVQWASMQDEANGIAEFLKRRHDAGQLDCGKTLVLAPRRQFGYLIRDELRRRVRAAHSFFHEEAFDGSPKLLNECQAQQAFTLLTLLINPQDLVALRCWLGFGSPELRVHEYKRLRDYSATSGRTAFEALDALTDGHLDLRYTTGIRSRYG